MKKSITFLLLVTYLISVLIISGCNKPPAEDISDAVINAADYYKNSEGIDCVGAFDGETVKFRLILDEHPTEAEAKKLLSEVSNKIESYSKHPDIWKYYNNKIEFFNDDWNFYQSNKKAGKKPVTMYAKRIN